MYFTVIDPAAEHPYYNGFYSTKLMSFDPKAPDKDAEVVSNPEGNIKQR